MLLCHQTIGVAVSLNDGPWRFAGIVPMLDPPRHDTKLTISRIRAAGVEVKMITGDHLNIAKETARLIDLGTNILPSTALWPASLSRNLTIMQSNGFAQVLPTDKQEIVLVEQQQGLVVGMTGDGVNDAAALSQAQVWAQEYEPIMRACI
jgi:H+-transporting ATPase